MDVGMHLNFLIGIISTCVLHVQSVDHIEDPSRHTGFREILLHAPDPLLNYSSVHYFDSNTTTSYDNGLLYLLALKSSPAFDFIISLKKVVFTFGYQDYLEVTNQNRVTILNTTRNECDNDMQFYGKQILLHFVTEAEEEQPSDFIEFSFSLTIAQKDPKCSDLRGFRCDNGYCIDKPFVCDGINNCGDFSDEHRCEKRGNDTCCDNKFYFRCENDFCVHLRYICDGINECGDFSDENNCNKRTHSTPGTVVLVAMFLMSIMGLISGFMISMCLTSFVTKLMKLDRIERRPLRSSSVDSSESLSSQMRVFRS